MPRKSWHNVLMSQAAAIPAVSPSPFTFDWREIERGLPLSVLEEFSAYSGIAVKDLLEVVIPARTLKHRRQRQEPLQSGRIGPAGAGGADVRTRNQGLRRSREGEAMAD